MYLPPFETYTIAMYKKSENIQVLKRLPSPGSLFVISGMFVFCK